MPTNNIRMIELDPLIVPNNPFKAITSTHLTRLNRLASEKSGIPGVIKKLVKKWIEYRASRLLEHGEDKQIQVAIRDHATFNANECNGQICVTYLDHYRTLYEPEIEAILEAHVRAMEAFIDCGANWGYFTGKAVLSNPSIKCWAIEPSPIPFQDLRRMVEVLGPEKDINLIQGGVSSAVGTFSVAQSAFDSGTNHVIPLNPSEMSNTRVECFPIDNLQVPARSLVKIDVEGHELEVLKGMSGLLKGKECIIIFEHWHNTPDALQPFLEYFSPFGFRVYQIITDTAAAVVADHTLVCTKLCKPELEIGGRYNLVATHESLTLFKDSNGEKNENG